MADPAAILGAISASVHLAEKILDYSSSFKKAPKEIESLMTEMKLIRSSIHSLKAYLEHRQNRGSKALYRTSALVSAIDGCQKELKSIHDTLSSFLGGSGLRRLWGRMKWPLGKPDAENAVQRLHRYSQIFHFAVTMDGMSIVALSQQDALLEIQRHLDEMNSSQLLQASIKLNQVSDAVKALPPITENILQLSQGLETLIRDRELSQLLEQLPCLPYRERHRDIQLRRMKGIGQWALKTPEFELWCDSTADEDNTLWFNGVPGAGKTYLASLVIDHLERLSSEKGYKVLSFYFDYQQQSEQTSFKILQTLLHQLLATQIKMPSCMQLLQSRRATLHELLSWTELKLAFMTLCNYISDRIFIVFDALDECDEDVNRGPVLELIQELIESRARILVTSRPYPPDVQDLLGSHPQTIVQASYNDIKTYVHDKIGASKRMAGIIDSDLQDMITRRIVETSQGMFLLPSLQVTNILGQTTKGQVIAALDALPRGILEVLDLTLDRIKSQNSESDSRAKFALAVLMWLSTARRPMTIREIQDAIAISADTEPAHMAEVTQPDFFVDCCFGLVAIDKETQVIRLVHLSISEYLQIRKPALFPTADSLIARSCVAYIRIQTPARLLLPSPSSTAKETLFEELDEVKVAPLLLYACNYWGSHAAQCFDAVIEKSIENLVSSRSAMAFWIWVLQERRSRLPWRSLRWSSDDDWEKLATFVNPGISSLHLAAIFGITALAEKLINDPASDIHHKDNFGKTPLMATAAFGRADILKLIVAQSDEDTINATDNGGLTALCHAMEASHYEIVDLLLQSALPLDVNLGSPLARASDLLHEPRGHAIVRVLLANVDLNPNQAASAPLWFILARDGHFSLLSELLTKPTLDPYKSQDPRKLIWELCSHATNFHYQDDYDLECLCGRYAIAILLDKDERFPTEACITLLLLWPAVYYAYSDKLDHSHGMIAWIPHHDKGAMKTALKQYFVQRGITFDFTDSIKRGFLHLLALDGYDELLQFMIHNKGAGVNSADIFGLTPVFGAVCNTHESTVRLLLDAGADPSTADNDGWTVFHSAAFTGNEAIIRLLVERGAVPTATDKFGRTSLHAAATSNQAAGIIPILIGWGVSIDVKDIFGASALDYAARSACVDTCKMLLDHNAALDGASIAGQLLHSACFTFNPGINKMLLPRLEPQQTELSCFGMNVSDFLMQYPEHIAEGMGYTPATKQRSYVPTPHVERRRQLLKCLIRRLHLMLIPDPEKASRLTLRTSFQLLLLGNDTAAQVLLEQKVDPRSRHGEPIFPQIINCSNCGADWGTFYKCRTCPFISLCSECRKSGDNKIPYCQGHDFLAFPQEIWSQLPDGVVNEEGQTFNEFLLDLKDKYEAEYRQMSRTLGENLP